MVLGDVVAGGVQQYIWRSGQDVACGSGMSRRGGRERCAEACCVALRGMHAVARLLQLRCADGHAVARVLPSGALVVLYHQRAVRIPVAL
jgi:hypothetical protein